MAASATTLDRETLRHATVKCFHCGTACRGDSFALGDKAFCCHGCLTVFELLAQNGLSNFYELADTAGVRVNATREDQFKYLDETVLRERLVNFQDERITRVTFHIPAIHCIACVWLLENLYRFKPGIGESQVNFPQKEVAITFENAQVKLSEVVGLLASLGLGTLPMMLGLGFAGGRLRFVGAHFQKLIPISVTVVAVLLLLRGMALGIPYLSPSLQGGAHAACH